LLPTALTLCLTLYVGFLGFGLLTGSGGLRLRQVTTTGLKIGAIVALTLNWTVFQTLVFNVAAEAPFEVGQIFAGASPGADGADDPLTRLEAIHKELDDSAQSLIQPATPAGAANVATAASGPQPPAAQALLSMATLLIISTVGLIALAMVAQAILVALGPAFMLFLLFDATRGLFVGWIRALAAAVIAPIANWGGLMVCLATLEPWMTRLAAERAAHAIKAETVSTLVAFVATLGGAQVVLAIGSIVITSAFTLRRAPAAAQVDVARSTAAAPETFNTLATQNRAQTLAQSVNRERSFASATEGRRLEVAGVAGGLRGAGESPSTSAGPRLGDTYRRPSPTGRLAASPAGARLGDAA
jgi:type IV secretion system protein VirB6